MKTPDNSIDFEPTSLADARAVESPAAHAARMQEVGARNAVSPEASNKNPEDGERIKELHAHLGKTFEAPDASPEKPKEVPKSVEASEKKELDPVTKFLDGNENYQGLSSVKPIEAKKWENEAKINKSLFKFGFVPAAVSAMAGFGSLIAGGAGVSVAGSVFGVPLLTAVAVGAAPVAFVVGVTALATWGIRRLLNKRRADKAQEYADEESWVRYHTEKNAKAVAL